MARRPQRTRRIRSGSDDLNPNLEMNFPAPDHIEPEPDNTPTDTSNEDNNTHKDDNEDVQKKGNFEINPPTTRMEKGKEYIIQGIINEGVKILDPKYMTGEKTLKDLFEEGRGAFSRVDINTGSASKKRIKIVTGEMPITKNDNGDYAVQFKRGDTISVFGRVREFRGEKQINFKAGDVEIYYPDTTKGLRGLLKEIRGVGDAFADKYIKAYGTDKSHLKSVDDLIKLGMNQEVAERVVIEWSTGEAYKEKMEKLRYHYKLSKEVSENLINSYGDALFDILKTDPWSMNVRNISFDVLDRIASENKIGLTAQSRLRAGTAHFVRKKVARTGSTCWLAVEPKAIIEQHGKKMEAVEINPTPLSNISINRRRARTTVAAPKAPPATSIIPKGFDVEDYKELVDALNGNSNNADRVTYRHVQDALDYLMSKDCSEEHPAWSLRRLENEDGSVKIYPLENYIAERSLAKKIASIATMPFKRVEDEAKVAVDQVCKTKGIKLTEEQYKACISACTHRFVIISGGAGTGKSTIQDIVSAACTLLGEDIKQMAPTGIAAKRLQQTTNRAASTVHRALEVSIDDAGSFEFLRNFNNPIEDMNATLICDEGGMMDMFISNALFDAFPVNGRVVIVGDFNQLASVGKGQVFKDIMSCNAGDVHVVKLTKSMRTAENSDIDRIAKGFLEGKNLISNASHAPRGVTFFRCADDKISNIVLGIVNNLIPSKGFQLTKDTVALSPINGSTERNSQQGRELTAPTHGSVKELNVVLKNGYNPSRSLDEKHIGFVGMTEGDPIMGIKNDKETDIRNGEGGIIQSVFRNDKNNITVSANFDGKTIDLTNEVGLKNVEVCYGITVHKFQGSERPCIIVVLPDNPAARRVVTRNLLYTAFTRTEGEIFLVGSENTLNHAVRTPERRNTGLAQMIREEADKISVAGFKNSMKTNPYIRRLVINRDKIMPPEAARKIAEILGISENDTLEDLEIKDNEVITETPRFSDFSLMG